MSLGWPGNAFRDPPEELEEVSGEEEMPEVEIDIDDLLEVTSDDERASKLQVHPCDCE
ncbi:hypothetical protein L3Q82_011164 [Scortum barcoo]|uniref:Uncharacterized protein n=1 Tax=Scortum barcoo TaxID=214431 RepID=A0ACB8W9D8_9TELE|nr:hypothetical protein L3Q82_011164 [Scortum barcoo]